MKLRSCWASAVGTIGGMVAGTWVGSLVGSIFGPVGAVLGGLIGSAIGSIIGGAVARVATEELIKWAEGLNPEQKEKVNWGIIANAMIEMGFGPTKVKPSQIKRSQVRSLLRLKALQCHPDKTGLMGKPTAELSPEEKTVLSIATQKMHKIQAHHDTLSAFIDSRDSEKSMWTKSLLSSLDEFYDKMNAKFIEIDKQSRERKQNAMRMLSSGGDSAQK